MVVNVFSYVYNIDFSSEPDGQEVQVAGITDTKDSSRLSIRYNYIQLTIQRFTKTQVLLKFTIYRITKLRYNRLELKIQSITKQISIQRITKQIYISKNYKTNLHFKELQKITIQRITKNYNSKNYK